MTRSWAICPVAERLARRGFYLPSGLALTWEQAQHVTAAIRRLCRRAMVLNRGRLDFVRSAVDGIGYYTILIVPLLPLVGNEASLIQGVRLPFCHCDNAR